MEYNKELVSFLEELKRNKRSYENISPADFKNIPHSWIAEAIYSFAIKRVEQIVEKS